MASKQDEDPKIMDISKPGKGKIVPTSRPVVAAVVQGNAESSDVTTAPETASAETQQPLPAPSASRRVIQPISVTDGDGAESEAVAVDTVPAKDASEDPLEEPESSDSLPTPKADADSPIAPKEPSADMSGAASVDEMAKAAEQKRLDAEADKAATEQDKKLEELTANKTYFVPIKGTGKPGSSKKPLIVLAIIILLALAGYLLVDAGVAGKNIKLPYEFIKDDAAGDTTRDTDGVETDPAGSEPARTEEEKANEPATQTDPGAATPEDRAADDDAREEMKNLQIRLETYFNDNDEYPLSLTELDPMPTTDELQNDRNESYSYTTDGQTYTLSIKLADGTDYTLKSVN